ncbi:DUF2924 domain-containing protein [Sphingomicrobium arenosum]|uniref:DUF2924 domain-containing protein n=1 Tax=Sphingomicrobium arenosum TaxID=2233861 RepID=UPI002240E887|nr:DUF2924 domain-containing protein [Sphingomicrobium arenosum]
MSDLAERIEALERLDLSALREHWPARFGPMPPIRSTAFFRMLLAWRLQAEAHGGHSRDTKLELKKVGPVATSAQQLGVGTVLERSWKGALVRVEVAEEGFRYGGRTYSSLSRIAQEITGTRWSGPRFFGLRS